MIPQQIIDEIKATARIEDVVGDFLTLKKKGASWVCTCPFHDDKNPSMTISSRLNIYHCFVCDAKGNSIDFLKNYQKLSFYEALQYLAKKYSIAIPEEKPKNPEEIAAQNERDALFLLNQFAENYFIDQLFNTEEGQNIGLSYLKERGLSETIIKKFKLGYSPEGWTAFTDYATSKGYKEEYLIKTGLTKVSESGKKYDFFHGRIMFPIHTISGKTIGFGGRTLLKDFKGGKYFNSPENEIYHKKETLYGIDVSSRAARELNNVYLVEGYMDVISLHASGIENVVAASGTAFTPEQVKMLSRMTRDRNITVLFDGDSAGIKASKRSISMLLEADFNVKVLLLPDGEDPDSFARQHDDEYVKRYFEENATNFILFKANLLSSEAGNDPIKRAEVVTEIVEDISLAPNNIVQAFYIKQCAEIFNIPEETLNISLRKVVWKRMNTTQRPSNPQPQELSQVIATPQPPQQSVTTPQQLISQVEENIIALILQFGMYEVEVAVENECGETNFQKERLDQYIFNEFSQEQILFTSPLMQIIYQEYAKVAISASSQEEIQRYFTTHENSAISNFAITVLSNIDLEISPLWESRFDITTHYISNYAPKLNKSLECHICMFKLRLIDRYRQLLLDIFEDNPDEETVDKMMVQIMKLNARREELAKMLKIVTL
jgi:DNA primase